MSQAGHRPNDTAPRAVVGYGLLGLIPFAAPVAFTLIWPQWGGLATLLQALYAALILSFLGGVRWGLAISRPPTSALTISLSMLPTLAALAILALLSHAPRLELWALSLALTLHWAWDARAHEAPAWFARLRTLLTLGAVSALLVGAWAIG